jgi:hypothetical protein
MPTPWTQRLQSTWQARVRRQPEPQQVQQPLLRTVSQRTEVFPPDRLYRVSRWRRGLRDWLNTGWDVSRPAELNALPLRSSKPQSSPSPIAEVRHAFVDALDDIETDAAQAVRERIARARSPRELWHLRTAVYTLIATQHSESQAQLRMATINRHFPLRTLCAGFWNR